VALDTGQPRITVRLRESMLAAIDSLAAERGRTRTEIVRDLLSAGLRDRPTPQADPMDERELLAVLNEAARRGNVSAARSLLARRGYADPQEAARAEFRWMVEERRAAS
jgi:metal-responsive CopG/Arc/MetJ family transcriptional regulator